MYVRNRLAAWLCIPSCAVWHANLVGWSFIFISPPRYGYQHRANSASSLAITITVDSMMQTNICIIAQNSPRNIVGKRIKKFRRQNIIVHTPIFYTTRTRANTHTHTNIKYEFCYSSDQIYIYKPFGQMCALAGVHDRIYICIAFTSNSADCAMHDRENIAAAKSNESPTLWEMNYKIVYSIPRKRILHIRT